MVKINDPRKDTAAIAMRSLRATKIFKIIKKNIKKNKNFDEDKLNLKEMDIRFYNDFILCPESIKQELIFLWEEVGDLYEELENKEQLEDEEQLENEKQLKNDEQSNLQNKRIYIMGP